MKANKYFKIPILEMRWKKNMLKLGRKRKKATLIPK